MMDSPVEAHYPGNRSWVHSVLTQRVKRRVTPKLDTHALLQVFASVNCGFQDAGAATARAVCETKKSPPERA
jgi:hypothetical protein